MKNLLETVMLICFGFSWPISVYHNIKARTAKSMSVSFILLIMTGYVMGICAKIADQNFGYVLAVYIINLSIVFINLLVYFRNKRLDRTNLKKEAVIEMPAFNITHSPEIESRVNEYADYNSLLKLSCDVFIGSDAFAKLPVAEYFSSSGLNIPVVNRSIDGITVDDACYYSEKLFSGITPHKIVLCFGGEAKNAGFNEDDFLKKYEWLLYSLTGKFNAELILVSMKDETGRGLSEKIGMLAKEYGCEFISIDADESSAPAIFRRIQPYLRDGNISFSEAINA